MKSINRAWLGWFGRIVFTIFAVWFLATKLNWGEFGQIVRVADPRWLALALMTYGGVVGLSILRWHLLLEVAGAAVGANSRLISARAIDTAPAKAVLTRARISGDMAAASGPLLFFFYGSLRAGCANHHFLQQRLRVCRPQGAGRTVASLFMVGLTSRAYPFLLETALPGWPHLVP
jgi:hypothetical protein